MWCVTANGVNETEKLGAAIGKLLKGGEIIELTSDLGGGKTTFAKGIARGAGSKDLVSSPTFTVSNIYEANSVEIHHYDFYRLDELGLMSDELHETMSDPKTVSIVEWAGEAHDLFPKDRLVRIQLQPVEHDENQRTITIQAGSQYESAFESLGLATC